MKNTLPILTLPCARPRQRCERFTFTFSSGGGPVLTAVGLINRKHKAGFLLNLRRERSCDLGHL